MGDIVERLRKQAERPGAVCVRGGGIFKPEDSLEWEAAETITRLRSRIRELESAQEDSIRGEGDE